MSNVSIPSEWSAPPTEFSLAPFWFWNDELTEAELMRQLDEFQSHGVDAFVLHPRVGLPRHMGWMSQALLEKMHFAIKQAEQRGMWVILYDEGMYPSGSASGQVVAENPDYHCRGLVRINLDTAQPESMQSGVRIDANGEITLTDEQTLVAEVSYKGQRYAIVDRPVDSVIRGLHFEHEDTDEPPEDNPPATDLLNPDAVACFIRLVYERYFQEFKPYFGTTIRAIFTDEPMLLGRPRESDILPGTRDILDHVNAYLGYDFTPNLPALWEVDAPQTIHEAYERAVEARFEATYYTQLYAWCAAHQIALTGHPAEPDATRHLRYFHIPGQDIVWRQVEPDHVSALEGRQSTQAKAAASMMVHGIRRRNANEFCGAFGHELTFEEMRWLANWLLIRGCNLLIPHAFYYSVRGSRKHERPPDVGLHSAWWDTHFTAFARACRRLCWLNTDSQPVCHVAILGAHHQLPFRAAKACFQNQIDFHYLDADDLLNNTQVVGDEIHIAGQHYPILIVDSDLHQEAQSWLDTHSSSVNIVYWTEEAGACIEKARQLLPRQQGLRIETDSNGLRVRHVQKAGLDWYILFNEASAPCEVTISNYGNGEIIMLDPYSESTPFTGNKLQLEGHECRVLIADSLNGEADFHD
ncbi:MAG: hypothetical protein RIC84_16765 [Aggregatilineales bacterium]